jgi:hypothetical protein
MDHAPSNIHCDLSGVHQMVQLSPISVVVNDTSNDSNSVQLDCLWVNTSNDSTRFCKGKRTCVELGRTTGVCTIVRIRHAF